MKSVSQLTSLVCLMLCIYFPAQSQTNFQKAYPYLSVGVNAGTQGLGLTVAVPVSYEFGFQVGANFLPFNTSVGKTYNSYHTNSDVSARFSNIHLLADWFPFYSKTSFLNHIGINAGAGYFYKANGNFQTSLTNPYYYGDIEVAPAEVGVITTEIDWKGSVAPYLGLSLNDFQVHPKLAFGASVGAYYLNRPTVSMYGTELLQGNESNGPIIENNVKNYRFLPVLQLNFSYKIK